MTLYKTLDKTQLTLPSLLADGLMFYGSMLVPLIAYPIVFGYFFSNDNIADLSSMTGKIWFGMKIIWYTNVLLSLTNLVGIIIFGSPKLRDEKNIADLALNKWNVRKKLKIVYVSRGDNSTALGRAIMQTLKVLHKYKVNFQMEVVTDLPVWKKLEKHPYIDFHVVPKDYTTKKGAKYKARALHYLIESRNQAEHRSLVRDSWLLHLDEESVITPECIAGISKFINDPTKSNSIGQGEIKYNSHKYGDSLLITAIDSIRTGDDLGRFRFQYKLLKKPVFGMHGSYFLVPQYVEKYMGFDLGGKGSITEDAYFALLSAEKGFQFQWIEGFIREQSPFTVGAILKQRRRWYCGLRYLGFDRKLQFRTRVILLANTFLWTLSWLGPVVTLIMLFRPNSYAPLEIVIPAAVIQGSYVGAYLVGAYRNLIDTKLSPFRKLVVYAATFILMPFSSLVEGMAILYAIIRPVQTFDVVKK